MKIGILFGALAPKLHEQLQLPRQKLRYLQECADGIVALSVGGLLSDAEVHRARRRLVKRVLQTFGNELRKRSEEPIEAERERATR